MKKLLFLTVLTMLFAVNAAADTKSGIITGTSINWTYDTGTNTLTLSGSGALPDYNSRTLKNHYFRTAEKALIATSIHPVLGNEEKYYVMDVVKHIIIENGINTIGMKYFSGAEYLEKLTLSESVTVIKDDAFEGCTSLSEIDGIINNDIEVARSAFEDCQFIEENDGMLVMGNTLVAAYTAFELVEITVPENVTKIKSEAFKDYISLQTIIIEGNLTSIGDEAFSGCSKLNSINVPHTVTSWGKNIFEGCDKLPNDGTYQKAGDHVIVKVYDEKKSKYTIADGIKYIADYAFKNCTNIKYIECEGNSSPLLGDNALPTINYTTIVPYGCEPNYSTWKNVNTTKMTLNKNKLTTCTFLHNARIPDDIAVYRAETEDNDINLYKINLGEKSCIVPAGVGIILKAYSNVGEITFENAGETNFDFETKYGSNKLVGCLEDTPLDKKDNAYGLATIDGVQKFLFIDIATTMPVGKAYLDGTGINTNSARILYEGLTEEDMETDIDEVNASETSSNTRNSIYNLAGQKLTHAQNGLNIVNGKIVIK